MVTKQMTYITDSSDKLFLSREACVALGIIHNHFSQTLASTQQCTHAIHVHEPTTASCYCPKRQLPHPPPESLPFPATEENRDKLQQYLLSYYGSSTFNTCEHQQLPLMNCPPLKLMVNPNAKPVAHHTPVPVPLHSREAVKQGLDQDLQRGH